MHSPWKVASICKLLAVITVKPKPLNESMQNRFWATGARNSNRYSSPVSTTANSHLIRFFSIKIWIFSNFEQSRFFCLWTTWHKKGARHLGAQVLCKSHTGSGQVWCTPVRVTAPCRSWPCSKHFKNLQKRAHCAAQRRGKWLSNTAIILIRLSALLKRNYQ